MFPRWASTCWLLLVLAVQPGSDPGVEREGVPGEPASRPKRGSDALEDAPPDGPGRQVQQCAERAVDQPRRLIEGEVAHICLAQVQLDTCPGCPGPGLGEHRRDEPIPVTGRLVACATGIATLPLPTASSTSGSSAAHARST
jgi:hypothetical protein